jgi:diacylglycerol kinase (CTP)
VPLLGLPLAPRKSLAGFLAASITGAATAILFWRFAPPFRLGGASSDISWSFDQGFQLPTDDTVGRAILDAGYTGFKASGWLGLGLIGLTAGIVTGIAEALGMTSLSLFSLRR